MKFKHPRDIAVDDVVSDYLNLIHLIYTSYLFIYLFLAFCPYLFDSHLVN